MPENVRHTKNEIYLFLRKSFFAVLSFKDKDNKGNEIISSELMIFNTTNEGDFYLTTRKSDSKFSEIKKNEDVTLLIYKEEYTNISMALLKGLLKSIIVKFLFFMKYTK